MKKKKIQRNVFLMLFVTGMIGIFQVQIVAASALSMPNVQVNVGASSNPQEVSSTLQLLFFLTIISLAPSLMIMVTSFTRIIISLHFIRSALGTQQMPPNQVLIGLALFLTLFVMGPIFTKINDTALVPYTQGQLSQEDAIKIGMEPLRKFMFDQVENKDVALFLELSHESYATQDALPNRILIPAFMLGEITKAFKFGVIIYIPFIVIDMVVASILMAMGMMMLPPAMISLPFKIMLFILAGGWSLVIESLIKTFRML